MPVQTYARLKARVGLTLRVPAEHKGFRPANLGDNVPVTSIQIRDLTVTYPRQDSTLRFVALWKVNLTVTSGEFLAVVGPSGCGKTTLLNTIAGLIHPTQGEVKVGNERVTGPGPDRAMVFQEYALLPWRNVWNNIRFGLEALERDKRQDDAKIKAAIDLVGLSGFEAAYPRHLSGGMQQRVGLARAFVADPSVLLMDEPFAAVDAMTREVMQRELQKIVDGSGKTVVFITHSIDEAVLLGDRVVVATTRPGRVKQVISVSLPRPRWTYDVQSTPEYIEIRDEVSRLLHEEAQRHAHGDDGVASPGGDGAET